MAEQSGRPIQNRNETSPKNAEIDLRDPARYSASIEWIRKHVVLNETAKGSFLQLRVSLPNGTVSLFMDKLNHYIMGFRGADKIYILDDDNSERFRKEVQSEIKDTDVQILKGLGTSHGLRGLETFSHAKGGVRGIIFQRIDLDSALILSTYSRESGITYGQLRRPLSLLVCMTSESARIPMMQRDFTNMFYGHDVVADEAIRSYDDAKFLLAITRQAFPEYARAAAVEKLQKRAAELEALARFIEAATKPSDRIVEISNWMKGSVPLDGSSFAAQIKRFCDMCKELKISDPRIITQVMSTCRSESAIRAAKQGIAVPDTVHAGIR